MRGLLGRAGGAWRRNGDAPDRCVDAPGKRERVVLYGRIRNCGSINWETSAAAQRHDREEVVQTAAAAVSCCTREIVPEAGRL